MSCVAIDCSAGSDLQAVLEGDRQAWQRFYCRYQPVITASVCHTLRSRNVPFARADLDDLVGEVWLSLLRKDSLGLRRYDASRGRSLPSWIRLLAVRTTIDRLRCRSLRQRLRERTSELERHDWSDERGRPDLAVETRQLAEAARRAIDALQPRDRYFIELFLRGTDTDEVARRLNIAVATVHSRRFKLSQKLHRLVRRQQRRAAPYAVN